MTLGRREFLKGSTATVAAILAIPELLMLEGCPVTQSQLAQLVAEVGSGLESILPYLKSVSVSVASQIESGFQALQTAIQGWKPGNSIADIEQVVNAFVQNMALIPVIASYQPLVALIVATAEGIITLLVPSTAPAGARAKYSGPKKASEFRSKWNQIVKADSKLSGLEIS